MTMTETSRNYILTCLEPRTDIYIKNITNLLGDKNSEKGKTEAAKIWIKQLQAILDFIDGIKK